MQLRGNDRERLPASTGRRDRQGTGSASELPGAPRRRLLAQTSVVSATSVRTFLAADRGQHRAVTRPTTACPRGPPAQRADGHAGRCRRPSSPLPRLDPGAGGQSCLPKSRLGDAEPLLDTLSTCGFHAPGTRWHVPPCPLPVMPTRARTRASVPGVFNFCFPYLTEGRGVGGGSTLRPRRAWRTVGALPRARPSGPTCLQPARCERALGLGLLVRETGAQSAGSAAPTSVFLAVRLSLQQPTRFPEPRSGPCKTPRALASSSRGLGRRAIRNSK